MGSRSFRLSRNVDSSSYVIPFPSSFRAPEDHINIRILHNMILASAFYWALPPESSYPYSYLSLYLYPYLESVVYLYNLCIYNLYSIGPYVYVVFGAPVF